MLNKQFRKQILEFRGRREPQILRPSLKISEQAEPFKSNPNL